MSTSYILKYYKSNHEDSRFNSLLLTSYPFTVALKTNVVFWIILATCQFAVDLFCYVFLAYESKQLLKVLLPHFNLNECKRKYAHINKVDVDNTQICAGGKEGKDSCSGDSGGPLMYYGDGGSKIVYYAAGVTSYGVNCGAKGWPGVYTNVAVYYDWIVNKISRSRK